MKAYIPVFNEEANFQLGNKMKDQSQNITRFMDDE